MPVTSIPYQPATGQLLASYRPIVFKVQATATGGGILPPYVVCDIYIANVYYKSILRTAPESQASTYSIFQFDISDALQEYLQPDIAQLDNNNVLQAPHMSAKVFCRFRASDKDSDGFTVEEGTKPVQGTNDTNPISGTGTQSNTFFVINAALQHEDNQNLQLHLTAYKQGTWATNAFPLTHRNRYYFCNNDSDHYPIIFTGDCIEADLKLNYRLKGQTSFQVATAANINICNPITFDTDVTGNRVDVHMDAAIPSGQSVVVQYKKQADSVWIDAGTFTTQDFFFNVNGNDIAGDYDIRVILFCTPCLSADPATGTFTLSGTVTNLDWRGINPFCIQGSVPATIYIVLDLRNQSSSESYIPDNINPTQKTTTTTKQVYAKFFSDSDHLNPLNVVQNGLKIHIRGRFAETNFDGVAFTVRIYETVTTYTVNANGIEVLVATLETSVLTEHYNPYPTVVGWSGYVVDYYPYPTHLLIAGGTGQKGYSTLEEYNVDTNIPTGNYKANNIGDPDYIAPVNDTNICPVGPNVSTVTFGEKLEIGKVEIRDNNNVYYYAPYAGDPPIGNTSAGGYVYCLPLPKNLNEFVTVRIKSLDSGNVSGYIKCRVSYYDANSNLQVAEFNVLNNIETAIPQTFQNITNINITNY
jgi:hypothetical protein